jgi:hypothetical protein
MWQLRVRASQFAGTVPALLRAERAASGSVGASLHARTGHGARTAFTAARIFVRGGNGGGNRAMTTLDGQCPQRLACL